MVVMSFETMIPFVIKHNAVIIQALVALILLLVAVLATRNFLRSGDTAPVAGSANLEQLEGTLKKLLERAGQVPAVPANAESAQLVAEIETLRSSLAEKQEQIEQMKLAPRPEGSAPAPVSSEAPAAGVANLSSEDKRALEDQIRDLQAKLAEYEIISEDIADLSFYKEENVKLQKQLEGLKGGAPVAATPAAAVATPAAPAPVPAPAEIDPAQAMVDSLMATPPEELAASVASTPAPERNSAADEDLLKEFADAVSAQGGIPAPEEPSADAEAEAAAAGLFDVERMTQEAGQLEKIAATVGDAPAGDALEAGLDAERLAAEAASMESIKPEDAKLMGDFEDFMKKGGA